MHGVLAKTHEMQGTEAIDRTNLGVGNDLGTDDLATVPGFYWSRPFGSPTENPRTDQSKFSFTCIHRLWDKFDVDPALEGESGRSTGTLLQNLQKPLAS